MLGRFKLWLAAAGGFILALGVAYLRGKSAGANAEQGKQVRRRIEAMKTAKDVRDEVESDPHLADRASRWVRNRDDK